MTADLAARHRRGIQLAFVNFIVMMLPVVVQPGVGYLAGLLIGQVVSQLFEIEIGIRRSIMAREARILN